MAILFLQGIYWLSIILFCAFPPAASFQRASTGTRLAPTIEKRHPRGINTILNLKSTENIENHRAMLDCRESTKKSFEGKSVLLTGASGGLGKALALELAHCNLSALVLSGRNEISLNEIAKDCLKVSPSSKIHVVTCDLADRESVHKLGLEALSLCDSIDVLINNGGVSSRSNFLNTKLEVDERVMQINFFSGASLVSGVSLSDVCLATHRASTCFMLMFSGQSSRPKHGHEQKWANNLGQQRSRFTRNPVKNELCRVQVCSTGLLRRTSC